MFDKKENGLYFVELFVNADGDQTFGVSQKSERGYPQSVNHKYSCSRIILVKPSIG